LEHASFDVLYMLPGVTRALWAAYHHRQPWKWCTISKRSVRERLFYRNTRKRLDPRVGRVVCSLLPAARWHAQCSHVVPRCQRVTFSPWKSASEREPDPLSHPDGRQLLRADRTETSARAGRTVRLRCSKGAPCEGRGRARP